MGCDWEILCQVVVLALLLTSLPPRRDRWARSMSSLELVISVLPLVRKGPFECLHCREEGNCVGLVLFFLGDVAWCAGLLATLILMGACG